MHVLFEMSPANRAAVEAAVSPFTKGPVLILEEVPPLEPPNENFVDEELAQRIAEAIRPSTKQPMREEVLRAIEKGFDSNVDQGGERDDHMRTGLGALSKALRPFTFRASPIELIAHRTRRVIQQGPYKGRYESTVYRLTPLGKRVFEILKAKGAL
jgi:hypothetical protein